MPISFLVRVQSTNMASGYSRTAESDRACRGKSNNGQQPLPYIAVQEFTSIWPPGAARLIDFSIVSISHGTSTYINTDPSCGRMFGLDTALNCNKDINITSGATQTVNICMAFGGNMSHRQKMDFLRICNRHFNLSTHTVTDIPCRGLENTKIPWCE